MSTRTVGKSRQGTRNDYNATQFAFTTATNWPATGTEVIAMQSKWPGTLFSALTVSNFVARTVFLPSHGQLSCFEACPRVHHVSEKSKAAEKPRSRRHEAESIDCLERAVVMSLVLLDEVMRMRGTILSGSCSKVHKYFSSIYFLNAHLLKRPLQAFQMYVYE